MQNPYRASRRDFIRSTGFAAGLAGLGLTITTSSAADPAPSRNPKDVLARLVEGNQRFVNGKTTRVGRTPADFAADDKGQAPVAAIVACADSRVAPELVFDQGTGDLFVVRAAGNVVSGAGPLIKGSLEFAVAELGVR